MILQNSEADLKTIEETTSLIISLLGDALKDIVPAFQSITLFTDLSIEQLSFRLNTSGLNSTQGKHVVNESVIPICYELGLDLEAVAKGLKLKPEELIQKHLEANYQAALIGFTPGFLYLSGLPETLSFPRRSSPRKIVEVGSVGIGGSQAGIYSLGSPGGWNIIGRTPIQLFDKTQVPPMQIHVGATIRFKRISKKEFEEWES